MSSTTRTQRIPSTRGRHARWRWLGFGLALASFASAAAVSAHPLAPAALILREVAGEPPGTLTLTWRTSRIRPRGERLTPRLPERCALVPESEREELVADVLVSTSTLRCGPGALAGLEGQRLHIDGLEGTETNVFVELQLVDGRHLSALLHARTPSLVFTATQVDESSTRSGGGFVMLGFGHLLSGADHVLFVLGLVLLVSGLRELVWLVSAFTLGHSVSLALSATGVVQLPSAPVEMVIALSLLWLALRVLEQRAHLVEPAHASATPGLRRAIAVCAAFGLLHGLGFASAFAETGASGDALPSALFGFNVGVELGQLAIVLPAALALRALRARDRRERAMPREMVAGAYAIGSASAYFVLGRAPAALADLLRAVS